MAFFIGLLSIYLLAWLVGLLPFASGIRGMEGVIAAALMFGLVGLSHFMKPEKLEAMIPASWPYKRAMNYISGLFEIIFGIALLFDSLRIYAAIGLILLMIAVFPANIYVAATKKSFYNISRLFFQPLYIAWIWYFCL